MIEKIQKSRRNATEEDDGSSVVTRGGERPPTGKKRREEVEMKKLMGGAPEVVSTIQTNSNTNLEILPDVVVEDKPWLRPGVIESTLMPRVMPRAENLKADVVSAEANEEGHIPEEISQIYGDQTPPFGILELYKKLNAEKRAEYIKDLRTFEKKNKQQETNDQEEGIRGEDLGNDIYNTLSDPNALENLALEKAKIAATKTKEPLIQVETKPGLATGWQPDAAPLGRVMPRMVPADTEPLIQVETKSLDAVPVNEYMELIQNMYKGQPIPLEVQAVYKDIQESVASKDDVARDAALEKLKDFVTKQQEVVNAGIEPSLAANPEDAINHASAAPEEPTPTETVSEEESTPKKAKETGEHKKWGEFEDIEHKDTPQTEGTPKEWRDKLRELIDGAKEKLSGGERAEQMKGYVADRLKVLDQALDVENRFRSLGEKYDKLGWKSKLAVGVSLGVGAGVASAFSFPTAIACLSGIAVQRVAGLSSSFLKYEKETQDQKWGKEKAMGKAIGKATLMTGGMMLLVEGAKEATEWLKHYYTSGHIGASVHTMETVHPITVAQTSSEMHVDASVGPAAVAAAGVEAAGTAVTPEIPGIEVTATPGHGYEYMMKRLWEQLQEKNIQLPANANPDSDLAQLLRADEKTIDGVVHRLAQDNEFFKGDGTSAHINLDSKLTIDTNGQIWLDHENILAPEDAPVTPAYHAEVPAPEAASSMIGNEIDVPSEQAVPTPSGSELAVPTAEGQESQVPVESHETPASPPASVENVIPNKFELSIPTTEPHIYENEAKSLFVYGGTADQKMKMITEYLTKNPDRVLYAEDVNHNRVPWLRELGGQGKIIQGPIMRTSGLAGLFSSLMKAPSPDDLKTLVK